MCWVGVVLHSPSPTLPPIRGPSSPRLCNGEVTGEALPLPALLALSVPSVLPLASPVSTQHCVWVSVCECVWRGGYWQNHSGRLPGRVKPDAFSACRLKCILKLSRIVFNVIASYTLLCPRPIPYPALCPIGF